MAGRISRDSAEDAVESRVDRDFAAENQEQPRFRVVGDGDIGAGVRDGLGGPVIVWLDGDWKGYEWAARIAWALNVAGEPE